MASQWQYCNWEGRSRPWPIGRPWPIVRDQSTLVPHLFSGNYTVTQVCDSIPDVRQEWNCTGKRVRSPYVNLSRSR